MTKGLKAAVVTGALILAGMSASAAHAQAKPSKVAPRATFTARDAFAPDLNQWGQQRTLKSLQWDAAKGKWGLKLDLEQNALRDLGWKETGAGAYYRVTPGLRVGGGVAVNSATDELRTMLPQQRAPKVKLETAFKF